VADAAGRHVNVSESVVELTNTHRPDISGGPQTEINQSVNQSINLFDERIKNNHSHGYRKNDAISNNGLRKVNITVTRYLCT